MKNEDQNNIKEEIIYAIIFITILDISNLKNNVSAISIPTNINDKRK